MKPDEKQPIGDMPDELTVEDDNLLADIWNSIDRTLTNPVLENILTNDDEREF